MKKSNKIIKDMTSVMIFNAGDSQAVVDKKFAEWLRDNGIYKRTEANKDADAG